MRGKAQGKRVLSELSHLMCAAVYTNLQLQTMAYMGKDLSSQLRLCHAEIPTLVFLTKIDNYDPDVIGQDLKKTFHSERLLSLIQVRLVSSPLLLLFGN